MSFSTSSKQIVGERKREERERERGREKHTEIMLSAVHFLLPTEFFLGDAAAVNHVIQITKQSSKYCSLCSTHPTLYIAASILSCSQDTSCRELTCIAAGITISVPHHTC